MIGGLLGAGYMGVDNPTDRWALEVRRKKGYKAFAWRLWEAYRRERMLLRKGWQHTYCMIVKKPLHSKKLTIGAKVSFSALVYPYPV
jgi:hypothetical protein